MTVFGRIVVGCQKGSSILLMQLSVVAVCLLGLTCSISLNEEAVRMEEEECQCDDVLRPMFWHEFLPSYLACQADLVCLLTRMRWMTAKGEINASGAISTFKKANPSWLKLRSEFEEDLQSCQEGVQKSKSGVAEIAVEFLHCLQAHLSRQLCEGCIQRYWHFYHIEEAKFSIRRRQHHRFTKFRHYSNDTTDYI